MNSLKKRIKKELEYTEEGVSRLCAIGNAPEYLPAAITSALEGCLLSIFYYGLIYSIDKAANPLLPATLIGALTSPTFFLIYARNFGKHLSERAPKA